MTPGRTAAAIPSLANQANITPAGTLDIHAGRDLSDLADKISAYMATLTAGRNITFGTIQAGYMYQSQSNGYTQKETGIAHQLNQISTGSDLR